MSIKEELLNSKLQHVPERLTLFSICCPCLMPKKLKCRASDIALLMYGKDEPHEYVVEKLAIKRVPLKLFGVAEDFIEYEKSHKRISNATNEKEITVTNYDEHKSVKVKEQEESESSEDEEPQEAIPEIIEPSPCPLITAATSMNSLKVNYDTAVDQSVISFTCDPLREHKSGDELVLRTITANETDHLIAEVDQRIAKMSPDLEKTINTLKAVKPRPVSTQGTPMPIKNQKKRLSTRNVEDEGILTKDAYNYAPCSNDNPLQGIHYSLNRTTFTPVIEEASKSIIAELPMTPPISEHLPKTKSPFMVEGATTNYVDATVLAVPEEIPEDLSETIQTPSQSLFDISSIRSIVNPPENIYLGCSSESLQYQESICSKDFSGVHENVHFSVYNAEILPSQTRKLSPVTYPEKKNLKWKIVINSQSKKLTMPTTSSSELQMQNKRRNTKRRTFWRSRV